MSRLAGTIAGALALPALFLSLGGPANAASVPLTQRCNADPDGMINVNVTSQSVYARIVESAVRPPPDPELFERLWQPVAAYGSDFSRWGLGYWVLLRYEESQDLREIAARIQSDAQLAPLAKLVYVQSGAICLPVWPPYPPVVRSLTEFVDLGTGHYRVSATPDEEAAIEYGREGGNWVRTGEQIPTVVSYCGGPSPTDHVYRFYAPSSRSYFFTASPEECGVLRRSDAGWHYQGVAFSGIRPREGLCPSFAPRPIYRLYNNRWMFGDSNHRYTVRPEIYSAMQASGWTGEGIAMCTVEEQ